MEKFAERDTDINELRNLEMFQNQFIRQNEVIDFLIHDINVHENTLVESVKQNPVARDHRLFSDHDGLRDRIETFLRRYKELNPEFMRYSTK